MMNIETKKQKSIKPYSITDCTEGGESALLLNKRICMVLEFCNMCRAADVDQKTLFLQNK
jgi:hypothetical protein